MEGIILFADDHIFDTDREENKLFQKFNSDVNFSILPINNLSTLEKAVASMSTIKALILDWNFERKVEEHDDDENFIDIPDENPFQFLKSQKIFSLVYLYSMNEIAQEIKEELQSLYNDKIFFEIKGNMNESDKEYKKIIDGINSFEDKNKHLNVPFIWSQTINQASQSIFSELEQADKYWIKELFYSSVRKFNKTTGEPTVIELDPTIEVITLFQNLISERLIQETSLKKSISDYSVANFKSITETNEILNLYSKLYYSKPQETDSIMTGDIYQLSKENFGIVISPECDLSKLIKRNEKVELLCFTKKSFKTINDFCKTNEEIIRAYNQEISALHLLPIFAFSESDRQTALIDFRFSLKLKGGHFLDTNKKKRVLKINSPYIQQLRQRYLSYMGRVGVPSIPQNLRSVIQ